MNIPKYLFQEILNYKLVKYENNDTNYYNIERNHLFILIIRHINKEYYKKLCYDKMDMVQLPYKLIITITLYIILIRKHKDKIIIE
jgi:hypothetical protein